MSTVSVFFILYFDFVLIYARNVKSLSNGGAFECVGAPLKYPRLYGIKGRMDVNETNDIRLPFHRVKSAILGLNEIH